MSSPTRTMLAHITFHNENSTNAISMINYNAVLSTLHEMETGYTLFRRIDAAIDVNPTNAFVRDLRRWDVQHGASSTAGRVRVHVRVHSALQHPFLLAWAHREHMARSIRLEKHDWYFYGEADVFVPAIAMRMQVEVCPPLYEQRRLLLGFARVSNDTAGHQFYSDIRRSAIRQALEEVRDLGTFVHPTYTYAATWAYPRNVMRDWLQDGRGWNYTAGKIVRERAGWGWAIGSPTAPTASRDILLCVACHAPRASAPQPGEVYTEQSSLVTHVGKSGSFFARVRGHNTLPVGMLVKPPLK